MQQAASVIPNLNGVRALAVSVVILSHAGLSHVIPGGFGVTTFFVLSGFLITTLLIREHQRTGTVSLSKFYARRALRLMPPLYVVTLLAVAAVQFGWIKGASDPAAVASLLLYYANYYLVFAGGTGIPEGLSVVWSLAVEEHFYFFWPPVLLWLFRRRLDRRSLSWLLGLASVGVLIWRLALALWLEPPEMYVEWATDARLDSLLAGCWLALVRNPWLHPPQARDRRLDAMLLLAAAVLIVLSLAIRDPLFRSTLRYTFQNVGLMILLWLVVARAQAWPYRALSHPVADYLGRVSYSLYLAHFLLICAFVRWFPEGSFWLHSVVPVMASLLFAELMRRWVEEPVAGMRARLQAGEPSPAATPPAGISRPS